MEYKDFERPLSVEEQIENLKLNHLVIEDEEEAKQRLNSVSYYRLIKAYGTSFRNRKSRLFNRKVTFNHIWRLYEFDNQLRYLLFPQFERIEITLRCRITNFFCVKYGAMGYLESNNFKETYYTDLKVKLDSQIEIAASSSPIVQHFQNRGQQIPLYAAMEIFSFGALALFYKSMKTEDQKAIAQMYYRGDNEYLSSWFESIAYTRNICAHFGRLYSYQLVKLPKVFYSDDYDIRDNNRLFRVLCCMRYLCKEYEDWTSFVGAITDLLDEYKDCVKPTGIGCSGNWRAKLLDQEPNNPFKDIVIK